MLGVEVRVLGFLGRLSQRGNGEIKEFVKMNQASITSYRGLKVWQEAMNLAQYCYEITQTFPKPEIYGMVSQIRPRLPQFLLILQRATDVVA